MANVKSNEELRQEKVEATVSKTEQFYNENKKIIWGGLAAVAVIALAILGYQKFIYAPKCAEAQEQTFPAEQNFQAGEYELALEGDGNVLGLKDIIKEYGAKAGKSVYMYAGVAELQLGNYEEALSYLKKYSGKDSILAARALACEGDAYVGLEDYSKAVACYNKAAAKDDSIYAANYIFKAGLAYEKLGQAAKALDCYKKVQDQYPASYEAVEITKFIARVSE